MKAHLALLASITKSVSIGVLKVRATSILRAALTAGVLIAGLRSARAVNVPIVNPSFEQPVLKPGTSATGLPPGWSGKCSALHCAGQVYAPSASQFPMLNPTDGTQVALLYGESACGVSGPVPIYCAILTQTLTVNLAPFTTYILKADFGSIIPGGGGTPSSGSCISIAVSVAGATNCVSLGGTATVLIQTTAATPEIGQPIKITLYTGPVMLDQPAMWVDNVRLDATPTVNLSFLHGAFGNFHLLPLEAARQSAYCDGSRACDVTFRFTDLQGATMAESRQTIAPGSSASFTLPMARTLAGPLDIVPAFSVAQGSALLSFEAVDSPSQRTRLMLNWGDGSRPRGGDIDVGLASITASDTGRLNGYCDGSVRACKVTFEFHDSNGKLLKTSQMTLQPGTAAFLDLSYREAAGAGAPVAIQPCWNVGDGSFIGSFAILDSATGRTVTQVYPAALASARGSTDE